MSEKTPREQIALLKNVIEDLQERVQTAFESIDAIVQALDEQHDEAAQPDFERLRYESEKQAYEGHPAARSAMPELYFLLLVSVLTAADATQAQWRHLYRTAAGAGYEADVRDLLPDAYSLTDAKLIEAVDSIKRDELTNAFILDCILLALLHEGDAAALLAYIADLFALLGAEKDVVRETMQVAKTIVAQDREAYLAMMADMSYLDAQESCCYLCRADDKTMINDLEEASSIDTKHITVLCVSAKNIELDLDAWKTEKITFQGCIFANSKIKSSKKTVHFVGCTFYENGNDVGNTYLELIHSSSWKLCTFKNIATKSFAISLCNAEILHCTFSDCSIHCHYDCTFLHLTNSTITNSKFLRCQSDGAACGLVFGFDTTVTQCNFSHCKTNYTGKCPPYPYILSGCMNSMIKDCHFEQCSIKKGIIIVLEDSKESLNCFLNCSCLAHVKRD